MPDLTAAVLAALPRELPGAAAAARARLVDTALRLALLAVAVAQAGLAWPALVSGTASMSAPVHMAHETGAWNLAVAAAFLAVAAAPRLAAGALPFLGSFAALLVPVTLADLAGRARAGRPRRRPPAARRPASSWWRRRLAGTAPRGRGARSARRQVAA